jgi:hypothetical protein
MAKNKLAIYLTYGRKGSGKSLTHARDALFLFDEYRRTEARYPKLKKRIFFSNQKMSAAIEKRELNLHLFYWDNAAQLRWCPRIDCWRKVVTEKNPEGRHAAHDCDIGWDEIGKDLPAGSWTDTPKWMKQIFSHLRKRGNRIFANTQVYEDIDISFRRQIDFAFEIKKVCGSGDITATRPNPPFVWGLIMIKSFDPRVVEWERDPEKRDDKAAERGGALFPRFAFIRKEYVDAYDTTNEIPPYKPDRMEHNESWCEDDNCPKHGKNMVEQGAKPVLSHHKI